MSAYYGILTIPVDPHERSFMFACVRRQFPMHLITVALSVELPAMPERKQDKVTRAEKKALQGTVTVLFQRAEISLFDLQRLGQHASSNLLSPTDRCGSRLQEVQCIVTRSAVYFTHIHKQLKWAQYLASYLFSPHFDSGRLSLCVVCHDELRLVLCRAEAYVQETYRHFTLNLRGYSPTSASYSTFSTAPQRTVRPCNIHEDCVFQLEQWLDSHTDSTLPARLQVPESSNSAPPSWEDISFN